MTNTTEDNLDVPRRASKIGRKFLLGYVPCTALVIAPAWAFVITKAATGPAAMAGAFIFMLWSIQISASNLLILLLRFTSYAKFIGRAILITIFSVALFPLSSYLKYEADLLLIGKPDLAEHLRENSTENCTLIQVVKENRINDTTRTIRATVQCGSAKTQRTCEWYFAYQEKKVSGQPLRPPIANNWCACNPTDRPGSA